ATGASGLGTSLTTARRRVPSPPTRTIASSAAIFGKDLRLDQGAQQVADEFVAFLDARSLVRGDLETDLTAASQVTAARAGEADHLHTLGLGRVQRAQDVLGAAGGGDGDEHVALLAQRLDLAGEGVVVAVVVADRGEDRGVGGQRDRRQARAVVVEAADQFAGPVLGVGGAAAVAGEQQL